MNDEGIAPHDIFYGSRPRLPLSRFVQPVTVNRDTGRRIPGLGCIIFCISGTSRPILLSAPGCGDGEGYLLARHHLASPGSTMDHSDPGYANRTTEGYRRYFPHAHFISMVGVGNRGIH